MKRLFLSLNALFLFLGALQAQPTAKWTVDAVLKQESIAQLNLSPDGRRALWTKRYPDDKKDRYLTDVYLTLLPGPTDTTSAETLQLTRTGNNNNPAWSTDGTWIAFASTRTQDEIKGQQIWVMHPHGGEPYPLTTLENGIRSFQWLDAETILFTAREDPTAYEKQLKKDKDDVLVVEDTTLYRPIRLFTVQVKTKKIERLTENPLQIGEFAASPDGRYVVYSLNLSPIEADGRDQPLQYLLDRETGTATEIFPALYFDPSGFQWTLDSQGFYASDTISSDPANEGAGKEALYYFDLATMQHQEVPLAWDRGVGFGGYAVTQTGIHVQLADGARMQPRYYEKTDTGWTHGVVTEPRMVHSTSVYVGPDGQTIIYDYSRPNQPPTYHFGRYIQGHVSPIGEVVHLNTYLKDLPMPRAEVIEWAGFAGDSVNGVLYYPLDYQEGQAYPLMVAIHGGPTGADLDAWRLSWTIYPGIWAQKGAFMLRPNYHGSGNHGQDWAESIKGRYYELEVPDIVAGVQHLIDRGMADADQLGVMGWSNGAILTTALTIEHPTLFKAAAPGAGDVNWTSDYGNCAFGVTFDNYYFKGAPWEFPEHYIEKSPLFRLQHVVTPTLILHGAEDTAVPTSQGWEYYRALQQIGKAPVRFLLFPEQPHGLGRLSHQKRKMQEEIAWFDQYLFGTQTHQAAVAERAVPKTAPLALLEHRRGFARVEGRYGDQVRGTLTPETVAVGDTLHVGRFEVTRAQFKAFRRSYRVASGTENHPANNISFSDARAYVTWLSQKTRRTYRLPTEAELKALRAHAGPEENTLAHWAGYSPTPDEQQILQARIAQMPPEALLMPVGSTPPKPDPEAPLLFDLDGNVAEWATTPDGAGQAMNGYAAGIRDQKTKTPALPPAVFTGLRVIRDP